MEKETFDAATMNFSLPHDVVTLPSGGIFYKNKKKSVKVGYLTAEDENLLLSSNSNDGIVLSLIRNKLYEHDIRPEELLEGDVETILIYLRNSSFGPEYNVTLNDPKTNKTFEHTIVLDRLTIKQSTVLPDENGIFTTTLPRTNINIKLRPLKYGEIIEINKLAEQYPVGRTVPRITWRLQKQIVEINGSSDMNEISKYIQTLPIADSKYIRKFLLDNVPSLDLKQTVIAPSGELVSFEITFGVEFFRPFF